MRIISGTHKGRILKSPGSDRVRPTSDRAKESLFNILSNRFDFEGMTILDLFCGTGSLGLECISRGSESCTFVDEDTKLVQKNIETLDLSSQCKEVRSDAIKFLQKNEDIKADIVFCDPPYSYESYDDLTEKISKLDTVLVLEHDRDFKVNERFEKNVFLKKKIGTVNFTFFDFNK